MIKFYKEWKKVWDRINNPEGSRETEGVRLEASFGLIEMLLGVIIGIVVIVGQILIGLVLFTGESIKDNIKEAKAGLKASKEFERLPPRLKEFNNRKAVKAFKAIGWLAFAYTIRFYDNETTILYVVLGVITLAFIIYSIVIDLYEMRATVKIIIEGKWIHRNSPLKVLKSAYTLAREATTILKKPAKVIGSSVGGILMIDGFSEFAGYGKPLERHVGPKIRTGLESIGVHADPESAKIRDESKSIEERIKQNDELKKVLSETSNHDYVKKDSGLKEMHSAFLKETQKQDAILSKDKNAVAERMKARILEIKAK